MNKKAKSCRLLIDLQVLHAMTLSDVSFTADSVSYATPKTASSGYRHSSSAPRVATCRRDQTYARRFKRAFDVALTLVLLLVSAPVLVPLIGGALLLVSLDGHSPFYKQTRIGRNGKPYQLIKIRSMVPNADEVFEAYLNSNPAARTEWEHHQKLRHDPRVTRIGQLLRRTSLDELPQIWNVLRGEMSLIGPRPMMVSQARLYPGLSYYALRPGITGLWQVSGRHNTSFSDRAIYDDAYLTHISFGMDFVILLRTVGVVLRGNGC